jgi:hypothetical protein
MRTDCKHYESRTYASGEVVRKCTIDLAPEAPWNCPADCPKYERRKIDAGWTYGSLAKGMEPAPPVPEIAMDADIAALLDATEDIVNAAGFELLEQEAKRNAARKGMFRKKKNNNTNKKKRKR